MKTRRLDLWDAGLQSPLQAFASDQLALLAAAQEGRAFVRLWRADRSGLSLGRYHRCRHPSQGLQRRLSGGRIVPEGPGVACLTLAAPLVDWLDPGGDALRPDQVLNRALRPLLAVLRQQATSGTDVFYPGRDLITVRGRALAHASFTVARDGVVLVHMHVADRSGFDDLAALLEALDPDGVAGADRNSFEASTSIVALSGSGLDEEAWIARLTSAFAAEMRCEVGSEQPCPGEHVTTADEIALAGLHQELGPLSEGASYAAEISMLGVVEVCARLRGDRLGDVQFTGDLIAPFHTMDSLSTELEGQPLKLPSLRRVLGRVLSQPRSFVLGVRDLDALLARLAGASA